MGRRWSVLVADVEGVLVGGIEVVDAGWMLG